MTTPIPAAISRGPFTTAEASVYGLSPKVLRGSRFVGVFPGVYALAQHVMTQHDLVKAAQKAVGPHAAASHESGLMVWGVDIGTRGTVHLTTHRRSPTRIEGITVHRCLGLGTVHDIGGCQVLSPERCLVDAATRRKLVDLVTAGDWLIRLGLMTAESFFNFVHTFHFDGVVKSRRVAELISVGSESPRESTVRMLLVLAGLPTPDCNVTYGDESGVFARLDLSYEEWKIAVEYDGRQHGLDLAQRERDVRRREAMERLGWVFIVVTAAQLRNPRAIVHRVHQSLKARGYAGTPPEFGREWCLSFEK